jgi:peptide/nickel transport system substrate-binding protein
VAGAYQAAAQAIGLKVSLKSVSANNYINFFIDPKARTGIDGFITVNYGDYADPAALLSTIVLPEGSQNYDKYDNKQITSLMNQARSTADPDKRAALIVKVQQAAIKDLPWIPNVQPTSLLLMNKKLSGATASFSYMFAPWADNLGGVG